MLNGSRQLSMGSRLRGNDVSRPTLYADSALYLSVRATRNPFCDCRTPASYLKRVVESM
jgi:hypothetical protein